jgi:preprotein translocase subunit SecF
MRRLCLATITLVLAGTCGSGAGPGPADYARIVDDSIRQTLTRSLYTVLAVAIGAVGLFFLGAEPLRMFSPAIFLGLVCGTYSSIFIAPAEWHALARRVSVPAMAG